MLLCVVRNVFLIILFTGRKGKSPEERAGSLQPDLTGQDNSGNECSKSGDGDCHSCHHPIANTNEGQNTSETKTLPEENGNVNSIQTTEEPAESTDHIVIDVTKATLPPLWKWLVDSASNVDDPTVAHTRTAVQMEIDGDESRILKSISICGRLLFYKVNGVSVSPQFLPKYFFSLNDLNEILSRFDSASLCVGIDEKYEEVLRANKTAVRSTGNRWRAKGCCRLLQKGSTCFRCEMILKTCQPKMDQLAARKRRDVTKKRNLQTKLKRQQDLIQVLNLNCFSKSLLFSAVVFSCFIEIESGTIAVKGRYGCRMRKCFK